VAIEEDHTWGGKPARFIAPADSPHSGHIVDLTVGGYAIVYRPVDGGAHIEIPDIFPVMVG
jgi:hypothetical protein